MALISNLSVGISANMKPLQKGLAKTRKKIKGFVKSVTSIKTGIVAALGGVAITAALRGSLSAWKEQEQAVASLEAANQSMGRTSIGITDKMLAHASKLQKEGVIGDEAIIQGQSFLSTFGQISDMNFERATDAMVDLMAKTKKSGQAAANMIGKAAMGMSGALQIAGITLSDTTKEAIKAENQMKKLAKEGGLNLRGLGDDGRVFKMILGDIESQIGGTNRALAKTASGGIDQYKNALGDMQEQMGKGVTEAISPWARQLGIEMGLIEVSAEDMGKSLRKALLGGALSAGTLLDKLNGIMLAFKTLQLGFEVLGLGLNVAVARPALGMWDTILQMFGNTSLKDPFGFIDQSVGKQTDSISELSDQISQLYDDVENRTASKAIQKKLLEFDEKATKTVDNLKKPVAPEVFTPKPTSNFSIKSGRSGDNDVRPLFPKVDRTNELLGIISNNIGRQPAVAG
jgi:hypothetical protein